jgi:hypothetical protein
MNNVRVRYCDPFALSVRYRADFGGNGGGGAGKPTPKIRPERYVTFFEGFWLRKGGHIRFNDYLPLFNWIKENRPKHEKNDLPYLVHGLSFLNYSINRNLKNWHHYVEPYEYIINDKDSWIYKAKDVSFTRSKPIEPIKWILENKPADETKSIVFLFDCLRLCNRSVKDNMMWFPKYASAYSHIINDEPARKNMKDAFDALIKEGKKPEDISASTMQDKKGPFLFTHLDNQDKRLAIGYINTIIDVYLYFKILNVKNELHIAEFQ